MGLYKQRGISSQMKHSVQIPRDMYYYKRMETSKYNLGNFFRLH